MSSIKMFLTKYFKNLVTNLNILITKCADDIVIVARTQKKLTEVYLDLEEETSKLGMEIN
jgi:short-subunit dehydrogenase